MFLLKHTNSWFMILVNGFMDSWIFTPCVHLCLGLLMVQKLVKEQRQETLQNSLSLLVIRTV